MFYGMYVCVLTLDQKSVKLEINYLDLVLSDIRFWMIIFYVSIISKFFKIQNCCNAANLAVYININISVHVMILIYKMYTN